MNTKSIEAERADDAAKARAIRAAVTGEADPAAMDEALADAEAEGDLLTPGRPEDVTLTDGSTMTVAEPMTLAWVRAAARLQGCIGVVLDVTRQAMADEGRAGDGLAARILASMSEADAEATMERFLRAVDAMMGQPDGWTARLPLADTVAVVAALLRVIRPARFSRFFGQAAKAAAMAKGFAGRSS